MSPGFDPLKAQVGPDEYFLLSRIDGSQTLREVILSTGLPVERAVAIVTRLRAIGALLLPGETAAPAPAAPPPVREATSPMGAKSPLAPSTPAASRPAQANPASGIAVSRTATPMVPMAGGKLPARPATPPFGVPSTSPAVARTPTPSTPMAASRLPAKPVASELDPPTIPRAMGATEGSAQAIDPPTVPRVGVLDPPTVRRAPSADLSVVLPNANDEERAALAEPGDLGPDERVRILAMARLLGNGDPYALLGVPHGADAKVLKRAYFKLSKDIHPDRYFGKQLGSFADRLSAVFEAVSRAYAKLTQPEKSRPSGKHQAVSSEQPQTPQEYAAELFERACGLEVGGDHLDAMKLFAAAVRIDPQTRYLRRAASCALQAEQPKTALEYAKKAQAQSPNDPSSARLLASAFKAAGKLGDAEEVLVMAMAIKSENDVLTAELRNDLAEVRRLLAG